MLPHYLDEIRAFTDEVAPASAALVVARALYLDLQVVDEIPKTASETPQERFLLERFDPKGPGVFTER